MPGTRRNGPTRTIPLGGGEYKMAEEMVVMSITSQITS
jgi:hypothetical protein